MQLEATNIDGIGRQWISRRGSPSPLCSSQKHHEVGMESSRSLWWGSPPHVVCHHRRMPTSDGQVVVCVSGGWGHGDESRVRDALESGERALLRSRHDDDRAAVGVRLLDLVGATQNPSCACHARVCREGTHRFAIEVAALTLREAHEQREHGDDRNAGNCHAFRDRSRSPVCAHEQEPSTSQRRTTSRAQARPQDHASICYLRP